jgi:phosphoribosylformimino-5-aminoimidazole carboxamide ribotide isomerase
MKSAVINEGCLMGGLITDFELIPAIDLKGGKCVRLQEGELSRATEYGDDPLAMAFHWQSLGASRLHLVDLDGAFAGESQHLEVAQSIFRELTIPVQFGGGLRSIAHLERVFAAGASRAILGTIAVEKPELVAEAVRRFGDSILVAIDARNGYAALRGWVDRTGVLAVDLALKMKDAGVKRIIYTDVSRDGMLTGTNVEETARLARLAGVRVIASGGASGSADVRALWERRDSGVEGVILGRSLYEKKIELPSMQAQLKSWS